MLRPPLEAVRPILPHVEGEKCRRKPAAGVRSPIERHTRRCQGATPIGYGREDLMRDEDDEDSQGQSDNEFYESEPPRIPALKGGLGPDVRPEGRPCAEQSL